MGTSRRRYLVAYDIRDDRRLRRVAATKKGFGWRMQYSVFIADLDGVELVDLKTRLGALLDHAADSVAFIDVGLPQERGRSSFAFMGVHPKLPEAGAVVI